MTRLENIILLLLICLIVYLGFGFWVAFNDHKTQIDIVAERADMGCALYALGQPWEVNRGIIDGENMYVCKVLVNGTWYSNIIPTGNFNVWVD